MKNSHHVAWLDHVRGLASLFVCAAHTYYAIVAPRVGLKGGAYASLSFLAYQSVFVFFIISGYAISLSIINSVQRAGRFSVGEYAAARLGRLIPPLIAAVIIGLIVYEIVTRFGLVGSKSFRLASDVYALRPSVFMDWMEIIAPLMFINVIFTPHGIAMNGSLWSLSFEFWLYVIAGLFSAAAVNRNGMAASLLAILLAWVFYCHRVGTFYFWYLPVWGGGALMAVSEQRSSARYRWVLNVMLAVSAMTVAYCLFRFGTRALDPSAQRSHANLVHACIALLFCATISRWSAMIKVPRLLAVFEWTASYSYTLYAIHFPLLLLCMSVIRPLAQSWNYGSTVALAILIFVLVNFIAWLLAGVVESRGLLRPRLRRLFGCDRTVTSL